MFTTSDVITIIKTLSSTSRMSLRRVIKISYLLDWYMSFKMGLVSDHHWTYGVCGPTDLAYERQIRNDTSSFEIREMDNHVGGTKLVVRCRDVNSQGTGNPNLMVALGNVKHSLSNIPWSDLSRIVASTYPMSKYSPGETFDMQESAHEYRELLHRRETFQT